MMEKKRSREICTATQPDFSAELATAENGYYAVRGKVTCCLSITVKISRSETVPVCGARR